MLSGFVVIALLLIFCGEGESACIYTQKQILIKEEELIKKCITREDP